MPSDAPVAVLRRYADAWQAGDPGLFDHYADDFTVHYFGRSRFAGTHAGRDAAIATMLEVSAAAPRELLEVEELYGGDRGAVMVVRERLTGTEGPVEVRRLFRYRVHAGRLAECWLHDEDQRLIDHLWGGEVS